MITNKTLEDFAELQIDDNFLSRYTDQNLDEVEYLRIKIDSNTQPLFQISQHLISLRTLILDNSILNSMRDFDLGFTNLEVLSVQDCGLTDLYGLGCLSRLKSLCVANNPITDVYSISDLEFIEVLDLSGTSLIDFKFVESLELCQNLRSLDIRRTLVSRAPAYRTLLLDMLVSLTQLDGLACVRNTENCVHNEDIRSDYQISESGRDRISTIMRPSSSLYRLQEATQVLDLMAEELADERRLEEQLLDDAIITVSDHFDDNDTSFFTRTNKCDRNSGSELTYGDSAVLAGNAVLAMRQRRVLRRNVGSAGGDRMSGSPTNRRPQTVNFSARRSLQDPVRDHFGKANDTFNAVNRPSSPNQRQRPGTADQWICPSSVSVSGREAHIPAPVVFHRNSLSGPPALSILSSPCDTTNASDTVAAIAYSSTVSKSCTCDDCSVGCGDGGDDGNSECEGCGNLLPMQNNFLSVTASGINTARLVCSYGHRFSRATRMGIDLCRSLTALETWAATSSDCGSSDEDDLHELVDSVVDRHSPTSYCNAPKAHSAQLTETLTVPSTPQVCRKVMKSQLDPTILSVHYQRVEKVEIDLGNEDDRWAEDYLQSMEVELNLEGNRDRNHLNEVSSFRRSGKEGVCNEHKHSQNMLEDLTILSLQHSIKLSDSSIHSNNLANSSRTQNHHSPGRRLGLLDKPGHGRLGNVRSRDKPLSSKTEKKTRARHYLLPLTVGPETDTEIDVCACSECSHVDSCSLSSPELSPVRLSRFLASGGLNL